MNWSTATPFLVIVNHYDADISWAKNIKLPYIIYEKDQPEKEPFNAVNKAKSETNLLKFIYQFYDQLPQNVITIHQYEYKFYHQGSIVDILNDPELPNRYYNSKTEGFLGLNTYILGYVELQIPRMLNSGWWPNTMEPYFGKIGDYGDFTLGKSGCAQFIVSRDRIRSLPREFYKNMYDWLVNNTISVASGFDPISKVRIPTNIDSNINSDFYTSRYMEWSWQLIFTTVKNENLFVNINGININAIYGAKKYYIDVTKLLLKNFYKGDIIIPKNIVFNQLFSDPVCNSKKDLLIKINDSQYQISENRENDVIIKFT